MTSILARLVVDVAANVREAVRARLERALLGKTCADWNERLRSDVEMRKRAAEWTRRAHERRAS